MQDAEEKVIAALKEFTLSIKSSSVVKADMSALINATSQLALSNLDYWEKFIRSEFASGLRDNQDSRFGMPKKPSNFLTWIDLISWDGYRRERALLALSGPAPNRFFLALVIRRLNDWVPQVRRAAREKIPGIVALSAVEDFIDVLCITLPHWGSWGRMEESDRRVLLDSLSNKDIAEALKRKIVSAASGPITSIFSQVGRTPVLDDYLNDIARNAVQPPVRAKAYRSQFERRLTWFEGRKWEWTDIRYCKGKFNPVVAGRDLTVVRPFLDILDAASIDSSPMVRKIAAEMLIRHIEVLGEKSFIYASRFASDPSPSVADRGLYALKCLESEK